MAIARKKMKDGRTRYYVVRRIEGRKVWYPGSHDTLAAARAVVDAKLTTDKSRGRDTRPRSESVSALVDRWLRAKAAAGKHRPRTAERRRDLYLRHVAPYIGDMRASAVREADVQKVVEAMAASGLAPATIDQAYRVVTAAFRFGKLGADLRDVERPDIRRRELSIPRASDVSALLHGVPGTSDASSSRNRSTHGPPPLRGLGAAVVGCGPQLETSQGDAGRKL